MGKRVFLVSGGRLVVYHWSRGRLRDSDVFTDDEAGIARFDGYLAGHPDTPSRLLVDVVEEEFREDRVPHVRGADRRALIQSKLDRLFRDATYSHALYQGREPGGRRDDRLLFSALVRPELLDAWMRSIGAAGVPLAGIYSLPIVSRRLLEPLGAARFTHTLLVTQHSAGGLRQTYFLDRELKLSRRAMPPRGERSGAAHVLEEVENVRRYLNGVRKLPHDAALHVLLLADPGLLEQVRRRAPDSPTTRLHLRGLEDVARTLGSRDGYASPYADELFARALARGRQSNHYAPRAQIRRHTLVEIRTALNVAAAITLGASLLWSAKRLLDGVVAARDTASVQRQAAFYAERYRRARERLPVVPAEPRDLRHAVELTGTLIRHKASPVPMMRVISRALDDFPRVQLEELRWRSGPQPRAVATGSRHLAGASAGAPARRGDGGVTPVSSRQHAQVKGRVEPFAGDYREALELVRRFAARLREIPGVQEVRVVSRPLEVGSELRLSGDASARADLGSAAFELRVALKEGESEA